MKSLYKIVHTAAGVQWQEPEKRILNESLWMQDQGHQIVIIAPPDSPLLTRAMAVGLSTYPLAFKGITRASQGQRLRKILEKEQPNILNAHGRTDGSLSLKAAKKVGVPCRIISCHSAKPMRNFLANRTLYKKLSHYVFTDSDHTTQRLKTVFKLKDMEIFSIPEGIAPPRSLGGRKQARMEIAGQLGLEGEPQFLGLLQPCKNRYSATHALQVLNALKLIPPGPHLLIPAATREIRKQLEQAISRQGLSGQVHLLELKHRWDYYRALSCGIYVPARRFEEETIPRALLEAMYAGCPVVAKKAWAISEVITNEKTGLMWQGSDPEQIASRIKRTLNESDVALKQADVARAQVDKRFTIDTMGRDITRIYRLHQVRLDRRYYKVDPDIFPDEHSALVSGPTDSAPRSSRPANE